MGGLLFNILTAAGDLKAEKIGESLDWTLVSSRLPADAKADQFTFQANALISPDDIKLTGELDLPKPTAWRKLLPFDPLSLSAAAMVPGNIIKRVTRSKKGRWLAIGCILLFLALALAGCFGLAIYGTFGGEVSIAKLEYTGGTDKATMTKAGLVTGKPIWTFTDATAVYQINLSIDVESEDVNGNKTSETANCTGPATFKVSGGVYPDVTIDLSTSQ